MMARAENKPLIPWDSVIAFGLGRMRLPPDQFWALSLREFRALLPTGAAELSAPFARVTLEDLVKRYPDGDPNGR